MVAIGPFQLALWLIAALTAVLCLAVLWRALVRPRRLPAEACCASCRYPVRGLETWSCPECGSDLRTVGVTTAHLELSRRSGLTAPLLACTVLFLILGVISWAYAHDWSRAAASRAIRSAPTVTQTVQQRMLITSAQPQRAITVTAAHSERPGAPGEPEITIACPRGTSHHTITLRPGIDYRWTDNTGADVQAGEQLTAETLAEFFIATGSSPAAAPNEADELHAIVSEMRQPPSGPIVATGRGGALISSGVSLRRNTTQLPVDTSFYELIPRLTIATAALLWLVAMLLIPLRRRRMLRRASTTASRHAPPTTNPPPLPGGVGEAG